MKNMKYAYHIDRLHRLKQGQLISLHQLTKPSIGANQISILGIADISEFAQRHIDCFDDMMNGAPLNREDANSLQIDMQCEIIRKDFFLIAHHVFKVSMLVNHVKMSINGFLLLNIPVQRYGKFAIMATQ